MAFCEDCGAPLVPGNLFCENCGAKLNIKVSEEKHCAETGIVYTNLSLLASKTGRSVESLCSTINGFISDAAERNVGYTLVDVSAENLGLDVKKHVSKVKEIVEKNHPDYLFIIGGSAVIPSIIWENFADDTESDKDVSSDLCYSTLIMDTPFDKGIVYNFDDYLKVGRLPEINFENYFENLRENCGKAGTSRTFAQSALVWTLQTESTYTRIKNGPDLCNCPEVTSDTVFEKIPEDTNLFLFNLHGSRKTEFWYGQEGEKYPIATNPSVFSKLTTPFFLAVLACYGAAYEDRSKDKSILLSCLNGKCISFLGSSRIAFGTRKPKGSCADVICEEFLVNMKKDMSAGAALNVARKELINGSSSNNTMKTLAEFSLYGDPSARMNGMPESKRTIFSSREKGSFRRGIRIEMPDVRSAVRQELENVNEKISQSVEKLVYENHKDLAGVKPRYYTYSDSKSDISAVFTRSNLIGTKIVSVSVTTDGHVKLMLESK